MKQTYLKHILMLCLCLFTGINASAYDAEINGICYNFSGNEAEVTYQYYDGNPHSNYSGSVVIPEQVTYNDKTYQVTSIGEWAFCPSTNLTSIYIPNSVTSIGEWAFYACESLTSVTIPNSVISIGGFAFYGTPWYKNQPDGLVYAGKVAYSYKGTMPEGTQIVIKDGTIGIAGYAFNVCRGLTSVTIPNSVTNIGDRAFYYSGLTSVTIPNSVTSIGQDAFDDTPWYNNQPDGLVYAGRMAYKYKGAMPEGAWINIEEGTIGIADYAFLDCSEIESVSIPNSMTSIGKFAFSGCNGLTRLYIPDNSVSSIGNYAFSDCSGMTSLTISNSVTSIGYGAFFNCSGLKLIDVEEGNTVYDSRNYCNAIIETATNTLITGCQWTSIPRGVTSIGDDAFRGCTGLTSITIPNSVISIGNRAFFNCSGLTSAAIPNSVTSIGDEAFQGCTGMTSVSIGSCVTNIGDYAFYKCSGLTSVTIPNSVTSIGDVAFQGCTGLTSVTIGNSVTNIGDYAFYKCSGLTSINIPDNVTSIGEGVFDECSSLTSFTIGKGITIIPYAMFEECNSLTSVIIPDHITSIGSAAFAVCESLNIVTIGSGVTSIGNAAFYGCDALTSVIVNNPTPAEIEDESTFSNAANATLFVPAGSEDAYKNAPYWDEFKEITWNKIDISEMDNVLYIEGAEAIADGGLATLRLQMKNSVTSEGFHFDLYLPTGCHFAIDDYEEEIDAELNYQRASTANMFLDKHLNDDGSLSVNVSSKKAGKVITGNDGIVMLIRIVVDDGLALGSYPIIMKNWGVTDDLGWVYPEADNDPVAYSLDIIDMKRGDANKDRGTKLNSGDYTTITHYILNLPYRQIDLTAADVNGDGYVDVADLSALADLLKKQGR